MSTDTQPERRRIKRVEWVAGVVFLAAIGSVVFMFFAMRVCDQQLTSAGAAVQICRHASVTDAPIVAAGLVALVSLGAFYTEISGFGMTLKRSVEQADQKAQRAEENTNDLRRGLQETTDTEAQESDPVRQMASRYKKIRLSMRSGPERTRAMEELMRDMVSELRDREVFDVDRYLRSDDVGLRLAGVAYLYANPDPMRAHQLVDLATSEPKPFNEYWTLLALGKAVAGNPETLDDAMRSSLQQHLGRLSPTSDRARVINRVLRANDAR